MSKEKRKPNFKADLIRGQDGEEMLVTLWPEYFMPKPPIEYEDPTKAQLKAYREYDLLHVDGRKVELKTEHYDHTTTPNFFMEVEAWGNVGGPWRARRDKVDIYVHLFPLPHPKAYIWEDVPALCNTLKRKPFKDGRVVGYPAKGLLVDRKQLEKYADTMILVVEPDE